MGSSRYNKRRIRGGGYGWIGKMKNISKWVKGQIPQNRGPASRPPKMCYGTWISRLNKAQKQ